MDTAALTAQKLLHIQAIKLRPHDPFTWASGWRSPIYCDNRMVLSHPEARHFVTTHLAEAARQFSPFDTVAGVATAGIAHGALLAAELELPFVYVREKPKGHGRQNQIEGHLPEGERVLVVEDLISTGGSCLRAVEAVRAAGCTVVGVLAIFSYGFQAATDAFAEAQCPFATLSHYDALLAQALATGHISPEEATLLTQWRLDPAAWHPQTAAQ